MKRYFSLLAAAMLGLSGYAQMNVTRDDNPLRKLSIAEMAVKALYVDEVDEKKLVEDAIRGMLEKLDPHSTYSTPKETKEMTEPLNGSFEGIGVQFNMVEDTLIVIQPVINGPSEKVGILAGDRIVMVNDTAIAGVKMSKEEIMRRLRGPKGTIADLRIVRTGIKDLLTFKVKRDKIPVHTVDATYDSSGHWLYPYWQLRCYYLRRVHGEYAEAESAGHERPGARLAGEWRWLSAGCCRPGW